MKNYLALAGIHARHSRQQSRMVILCIVLAVFLVTSVFSMADFERMHMTDKLIKDNGNWHISLNNVPFEEAERVLSEADVRAACRYDTFNYNLDKGCYLNGHPVCVIGTDQSFTDSIFADMLEEGHFPQNDSEIILSMNAKAIFACEVGDVVTVDMPEEDGTYTVCGFVSNNSDILAADVVIAVLDYPAFDSLAEANHQTREPQYYIQFRQSMTIKKTIAKLKSSHGWTNDDVSENSALLGITGMSTSTYIVGLYGVAAVLVVMVVLAGVFMISGSLNSNVAERTQFFGMIRCIGASKKQVRRIVRKEALSWLRFAIPIGIGASILACWGVCAWMAYGIGGEWEGMPVGKISLIGIAAGILVGYITVLLSANAPARKAAKVSPVEAVSGSSNREYTGKAFRNGGLPVAVSMGVHHTTSGKKNLLLMTGSFALSIILFLCFSVMITWVDNALTTNKPYAPDLSIYYEDYSENMSEEFAADLRKIDGVKYAYGRMHCHSDITTDADFDKLDLISYDDIQFEWAKKDLVRGDLSQVQDGLGGVMIVYDKDDPIELGTTVKLKGKTLTVQALLSDSPFGTDGDPAVICSEETFESIYGKSGYAVIEMQLDKSGGDETVAAIRSYLSKGMLLSDRREAKTESNSTYLAFTCMVYGFLTLIAMIAVVNIMNSISMSVTARRRQYGMMRAIGLDKKQLSKMVYAESVTYGIFGCAAGCLIGLPLHHWFFSKAITHYWGITWSIPIGSLAIIIAIVMGSAVLAATIPIKRLSEQSIIMTLNEA